MSQVPEYEDRLPLAWFEKCESVAKQQLNFSDMVREMAYDKANWKIQRRKEGSLLHFVFYKWFKSDGKFLPHITRTVDCVTMILTNIRAAEAIRDPASYIVAQKMGYLKFPIHWKGIAVLKRTDKHRIRFKKHIEDGHEVLEIKSSFGKPINLTEGQVNEIFDFFGKVRRLKNLKGIKEKTPFKLMKIVAKTESKKRRTSRSRSGCKKCGANTTSEYGLCKRCLLKRDV